ncbi:MAG TPA: alpha/beta hydrolase [Myxococcaceae bacterium]
MALEQSQQACGHHHRSWVLVHGAFMGSWVFDRVARELRAQGDTVVQVNLPAHGNDPLPSGSATLQSYVDRVSEAVHSVPRPVQLVGHSLAGVVITQYAEQEPSTVENLVYFAALVPADGQSALDLALQDAQSLLNANLSFDLTTGLASIPVSALGPVMCADCNPHQVAQLQSRYRDEPLWAAATPVHVTAGNYGTVAKRYLFTAEDNAVSNYRQHEMAATIPLVRTATLHTSHTPQLSRPGRFAEQLRNLVE